jgi:transposase
VRLPVVANGRNWVGSGHCSPLSRASLREKGAFANIPPKSNRRSKPYFSTWLYRERNLIERFFSKLKHFRRVATRYDKLAENFLAMVQLASMRLWLRAYESTA